MQMAWESVSAIRDFECAHTRTCVGVHLIVLWSHNRSHLAACPCVGVVLADAKQALQTGTKMRSKRLDDASVCVRVRVDVLEVHS